MAGFLQLPGRGSLPRELAEAAPPCKIASPGSLEQGSSFLSNAHLPTVGIGPCRWNLAIGRHSEIPVLSHSQRRRIRWAEMLVDAWFSSESGWVNIALQDDLCPLKSACVELWRELLRRLLSHSLKAAELPDRKPSALPLPVDLKKSAQASILAQMVFSPSCTSVCLSLDSRTWNQRERESAHTISLPSPLHLQPAPSSLLAVIRDLCPKDKLLYLTRLPHPQAAQLFPFMAATLLCWPSLKPLH